MLKIVTHTRNVGHNYILLNELAVLPNYPNLTLTECDFLQRYVNRAVDVLATKKHFRLWLACYVRRTFASNQAVLNRLGAFVVVIDRTLVLD
jgi:hypothetical protein